MISFNINSNHSFISEMQLLNYGTEDCSKGHSFGPYIRDFYLFHLVTHGSGSFYINKKKYILGKGDLFFIPPGVVTLYQADFTSPWSYTWIGLRSIALPSYLISAGLSDKSPVLNFSDSLINYANDIIINAEKSGFDSAKVTGYVYFFIDELIKCGNKKTIYKTNQQIYVETAVKYIHDNIYMPVSVSELSEKIGIDRSYLCYIFKKLLGKTPQQYILNLKIDKAKIFLSETNNEIKYIANSLGYDDPFVFSHAFKVKTGVSPKEWRKKHGKSQAEIL